MPKTEVAGRANKLCPFSEKQCSEICALFMHGSCAIYVAAVRAGDIVDSIKSTKETD